MQTLAAASGLIRTSASPFQTPPNDQRRKHNLVCHGHDVLPRKRGMGTKAKVKRLNYHGYIDVGEGKVVHDKVRCNFHCHAGDRESIFPKSGILEDVSQTDEGHILRAPREMLTINVVLTNIAE